MSPALPPRPFSVSGQQTVQPLAPIASSAPLAPPPVPQRMPAQEVRQYTVPLPVAPETPATTVQSAASPQFAQASQTPGPIGSVPVGFSASALPRTATPIGETYAATPTYGNPQNVSASYTPIGATASSNVVFAGASYEPTGGTTTTALSKLRTYRSDLNRTFAEKKLSKTDIVLAEERRRQRDGKAPQLRETGSYWGTVILVLLLFAVGAAAFIVGYRTLRQPDNIVTPGAARTPLIVTETDEEIEITFRSADDIRAQVRSRLREADIRIASIREYIFTITESQGEGPVKLYVGAPLLLDAIDSSIPRELARNVADRFMYSIFSFDGNRGFLILRPTSVSIAFASMLAWENNGLIRDMVPLLSPEPLTQDDIFAPFQDAVFSNQDTRIAYDPQGNEVLLYSLTSQNMLVIASDTETFSEVLARLNTPVPLTR